VSYARFVRRGGPIWDSFERDLSAARSRPRDIDHADLESLAFRYRQVLHDHALASARFRGTAAATRLARLALMGTHWLVRSPEERRGGLGYFFTDRFPRAFRAQAAHTLVAFTLFAVCAGFGFRLGALQPGVGAALLGPATLENLEEGRLWTESLVSAVPPSVSASAIARNNMSVALTGWAGGAVAGLGSLYVLVLNGLMLGAVLGITSRYAMAGELLSFVAAHGPLEISLILVTAGAGLRLGLALVVPGDQPRRRAGSKAGGEALAVLGGCLPWFLILGVVEATISPAPGLAPELKALLGLGLLMLFGLLAWGRVPEEA